MAPEQLLKIADAAQRLDVSGETVRRWAKDGLIPHVKLPSGKVRFRQTDIDAILNGPSAEQSDPAA